MGPNTEDEITPIEDFVGHHSLWQLWASKLWELPA